MKEFVLLFRKPDLDDSKIEPENRKPIVKNGMTGLVE